MRADSLNLHSIQNQREWLSKHATHQPKKAKQKEQIWTNTTEPPWAPQFQNLFIILSSLSACFHWVRCDFSITTHKSSLISRTHGNSHCRVILLISLTLLAFCEDPTVQCCVQMQTDLEVLAASCSHRLGVIQHCYFCTFLSCFFVRTDRLFCLRIKLEQILGKLRLLIA